VSGRDGVTSSWSDEVALRVGALMDAARAALAAGDIAAARAASADADDAIFEARPFEGEAALVERLDALDRAIDTAVTRSDAVAALVAGDPAPLARVLAASPHAGQKLLADAARAGAAEADILGLLDGIGEPRMLIYARFGFGIRSGREDHCERALVEALALAETERRGTLRLLAAIAILGGKSASWGERLAMLCADAGAPLPPSLASRLQEIRQAAAERGQPHSSGSKPSMT